MKTTEIYSFNELSNEAKVTAINEYRYERHDENFYFDEITESVTKLIDLFNFKTGDSYTDIRTSNIDDNILELSGTRLYKWLINNYYNDLFKGKYINTLDRKVFYKSFVCKQYKNHAGNVFTQLYSKLKIDNSCVLTGVCYDDDILKPIYQFLERPDKSTTWEDIINDIASAIEQLYNDTDEWINSDEFISETLEANNYEFTKDGNIF
jgi:hypothetical protein